MVDLPEPEGPDITIGRRIGVAIKSRAQPPHTLLAKSAREKRILPDGAIVEYWSGQEPSLMNERLAQSDAERIGAALLRHKSIRRCNTLNSHESGRLAFQGPELGSGDGPVI